MESWGSVVLRIPVHWATRPRKFYDYAAKNGGRDRYELADADVDLHTDSERA